MESRTLNNINDNFFIGNNCEFNIVNKITNERDYLFASGCEFIFHNFSSVTKLTREQVSTNKQIHIGPNVWLSNNVLALMRVEIAAGSVVVKSIPSFKI